MKRKRSQVLVSGDGQCFSIDEQDFLVAREILTTLGFGGRRLGSLIDQAFGIQDFGDGEHGRVYELILRGLGVDRDFVNPTVLAASVDKLTFLEHLDLTYGGFASLPASIGGLQNLKILRIEHTKHPMLLPDEIGDLICLRELHLGWAKIKCLPNSIGRLQNLRCLDLSYTRYLSELPETIGDLTSLTKLNLMGSGITSLPPSIGRLDKLRRLCLANTPNLPDCPEEIQGLRGLELLDLTMVPSEKEPERLVFLSRTLERCRKLGSIGGASIPINGSIAIHHGLARNRARSRMPFGTLPQAVALKLWPRMIRSAWRAFLFCERYPYYLTSTERWWSMVRTSPEDTMYQLISKVCAGEFVRMVVHRQAENKGVSQNLHRLERVEGLWKDLARSAILREHPPSHKTGIDPGKMIEGNVVPITLKRTELPNPRVGKNKASSTSPDALLPAHASSTASSITTSQDSGRPQSPDSKRKKRRKHWELR